MLDQTLATRRWWEPIVSESQGIAADPGAYHSLESLRILIGSLPSDVPPRQRAAGRSLLTFLLRRLMRLHESERTGEFRDAFLNWVSADPLSLEWRDDIQRVLRAWDHPPCMTLTDHRVQRAVGIIRSRFNDPGLTLRSIASETRVSVWHATRLLKRETGRGFLDHLHECRIAEGRRLLRQTMLSAKEIAAAIGYRSSSEFGRHFKRACGTTPHAYRAALRGETKVRARTHDE